MAAEGAQVSRYPDDDYAQVDGEDDAPFGRSMRGQPWVRMGGMSPWHMWGNTQTITTPMTGSGINPLAEAQLVKVAYKRPETWHWLFGARLISGPNNDPGFFSRIFVNFDVITGVGRSVQRFQFMPGTPGTRSFELFTFQWGPVNRVFPAQAHLYSGQAQSPPRSYQGDGPFPEDGPAITQLVAENIQVTTRILAITNDLNVGALGRPCTIEVSASFAPKVHVRPDWLQLEAPVESQFAGEEIAGR